MKLNNIYELLNELYPFDLAEEWDNVGFNNKSNKNEVNNVLITLDINLETMNYAINNKIDLIISHHPIYIDEKDLKFNHIKKIIKLANEFNISLLSLHTNFDKSKYGMNPSILKKLSLKEISQSKSSDYLYFGNLKDKKNIKDFLSIVKQKLDLDYLIFDSQDFRIKENKKINKIAIVAGAGSSDLLSIKKRDKIDVFITGEVKWHLWEIAKQKNITIVDIGHIAEKIFIEVIYKRLEKYNLNLFTLYPTVKPKIL